MNATVPAHLRIVAQNAHSAIVDVWGFPMECDFDYEEGEAPVWSDVTGGHPGSPSNAVLVGCAVGGVSIYDMLSSDQIERLEEACIQAMEG